jgi:ketosteroid isomerase-like protein
VTRSDLEAMFRAIDASDWDVLPRYFHADLVYDRPGFERLQGREAVLHFYRAVRTIRGRHEFEGFAVQPDAGACWGRFVGHRGDGTPLDLQFADCYLFRDGLMWRRKSFFYVPLA